MDSLGHILGALSLLWDITLVLYMLISIKGQQLLSETYIKQIKINVYIKEIIRLTIKN